MSPDDVPFLENPGVDGVVERELDRWVGKYERHGLRSEPIIDEAIRWFRENPPDIDELTVVHGDFRTGNTLINDEEITALLDWEMARLGDPMYDLGYSSMPYLAGKLIDRPTELVCAVADREWYYERYEELTGREVDRYAVEYWQAFAVFVMISSCSPGSTGTTAARATTSGRCGSSTRSRDCWRTYWPFCARTWPDHSSRPSIRSWLSTRVSKRS